LYTRNYKKLKPLCFSNNHELLNKLLITMSHNIIAYWELTLTRDVLAGVSLGLIFGSTLVNIVSARWNKTQNH